GSTIQKIVGRPVPLLTTGSWNPEGFAKAVTVSADEGYAWSLPVVRHGFVRTGGATNVRAADEAQDQSTKAEAANAAVGASVIQGPISVLKAVGFVAFAGGRGLLAVTDLDTLFIDLTIVALGLMLWRRADADRSSLCFAIVLALTAGVLMGYVVTNYGTLF